MCRWMGSYFHDWMDYQEVAFSIELLEWGRKFEFWGKTVFQSYLRLANAPESTAGEKLSVLYSKNGTYINRK